MWLLRQDIYDDIQGAKKSGYQFTAEQITAFNADYSTKSSAELQVVDGVAKIEITGVLTNQPDIMCMLFGGGNTTYPDIISALAVADANEAVTSIEIEFKSGGGTIEGLFDAIAAFQTTKKPIAGIVKTHAASAAYGLLSQCDTIIANNRASGVGSVGVVVDAYLDPSRKSVTSSNAPNKRPDLSTAEGEAVLVEELDDIHDLFAEAIAVGRGKTVEQVNANFGRGSMLLADKALERGMIDSIRDASLAVSDTKPTAKRGEKEESVMDLNTLKASHPDVYAQVIEIGKAEERDRVSAHLTMGSGSGDMETAIKAIEDGSQMTQALNAKYMMAAANRGDISARESDNPGDLDITDDPVDEKTKDAEASEKLLAAVFKACGQEKEA